MRIGLCLCLLTAANLAFAADGPPPAFARQPSVSRDGQHVTVSFAADRACDVAVYIENAKGKVVRHLAAGVLGANPPAPFQADALEQAIVWDDLGDDGKKAEGAPFKVRVGLGLKVKLDRFLGTPDRGGGEFAVDRSGQVFAKNGWNVQVFSREGKYLRTVMPFPSNFTAGQMKGLEPVMFSDSEWQPRVYATENPFIYPKSMKGDLAHIEIAPDGTLVFEGCDVKAHVMGYHWVTTGTGRQILLLNADGSASEPYLGPLVAESGGATWDLAVSPDSKTVYVTGLAGKNLYGKEPHHVVYRAARDARQAEVFLGEPFVAGNDDKHFNLPVCVATDGAGHVYVSDRGNDRVAGFDATGKFLGALSVKEPGRLAVHPENGAIYVVSGGKPIERSDNFAGGTLLKFAGLDAAQPAAQMQLGPQMGRCIALDASAEPPSVLVASGKDLAILRFDDQGSSFAESGRIPASEANSDAVALPPLSHLSVDFERDELYTKAMGWAGWFRVDGARGTVAKLPWSWRISQVAAGPDGHLFMRQLQKPIVRLTHDLKPAPFENGSAELEGGVGYETAWEKKDGYGARGLSAGPDGRIYYLSYAEQAYITVWGADGKLIQKKHVEAIGGRNAGYVAGLAGAPNGCVYLGANLKPRERFYPDELMGKVPSQATKKGDPYYNWYPIMYGSLLKFGPEGGTIRFATKEEIAAGAKDFPFIRGNADPVKVDGLLWRSSLSPVWTFPPVCTCVVPRFDIDGFERVFVPDAGTFSVRILDAHGNPIARFGGYGNWDSQGPGSQVPAPGIPFGFPTQVGVSRSAIYVLDRLNWRLVRLTPEYAASARVAIP